MSYYFRERPRFGERFRGKSGDELLEELKQEFGEDSPFFETRTNGTSTPGTGTNTRIRDPFERHTTFGRGFPFDDDGGFGRRSDIRAHLDDLAARHPEFADHLLGPPWAEVPFPGSGGSLPRNTRNRRASGDQHNNRPAAPQPPQTNGTYHNHPDEDTRSQASGGSAASGASAVSSHGSEPDQHQEFQADPVDRKSGLRNTLDIGQHQHNMENPQQQPQARNVRSMSAPPENRNNGPDNNQQRFVSRVDITPQAQANQTQPQTGNNQSQTQPQQQREKSPAPQGQKQQSNVRQIPIFVEGRDKPVIARERDEPDFTRRQQSPPHFQRPSHFQHAYNRQPPGWRSDFQDPFFEHSTGRWPPPPPQPQSTFPQFRHTHQDKPQTHNPEFWHHSPQQQKSHTHAQAPPKQQAPQSEPQPEAPPKPKQQVQPKDPLEKVAMVQKEVDALTEQVKQFTGNSRQDKQYMYLDEMLTRELIKLDDIDTEGKENVRQARKQAIKSIQESISLLESKAPLPGQQPESIEKTEEKKEEMMNEETKVEASDKPAEAMETSEEPAPEEQQKAIPLPPPLSPSKIAEVPETKVEENSLSNEISQPKDVNTQNAEESLVSAPQPGTPVPDDQQQISPKIEETQSAQSQEQRNPESMESSTTTISQVPAADDLKMEVRESSPVKEFSENPEKAKENKEEIKSSTVNEEKDKLKKEPPPIPVKPGKSPKKAKKTKKQLPEPVSETAIPLPAPGQSI